MSTVTNLARGVQAFTSNVFLVEGETTALVDVGANFDVVAGVRERVDGLDAVYLTHTHPDHVTNIEAVRDAFDVETWGFDPDHEAVDNAVADGETVRIGDRGFRALHTPGHKDDHLCFFAAETGTLFAGDLVFANGGFGRTDLPEGDRDLLLDSLDRVSETAGPDLRVFHPGHGPSVSEGAAEDVALAARAARFG